MPVRYDFLGADHCLLPSRLPLSAGPPSAVVYFKIAALRTGATESGHFYGAHVDPQSTVMIQTGLVQSLVPDVDSYLGIGARLLSSGLAGGRPLEAD